MYYIYVIMRVFKSTVVFERELAMFLGCHIKTAKKYYQLIRNHYQKEAYGLLSLEEVASYYQLPVEVLQTFEQ